MSRALADDWFDRFADVDPDAFEPHACACDECGGPGAHRDAPDAAALCDDCADETWRNSPWVNTPAEEALAARVERLLNPNVETKR